MLEENVKQGFKERGFDLDYPSKDTSEDLHKDIKFTNVATFFKTIKQIEAIVKYKLFGNN